MMKLLHLFLNAIAIIAAVGSCSAADPAVGRVFFDAHCVDCHGKDTQEGRFRADTLGGQFDTPESALRWSRVIARLEAGEMPPKGNARPPAAEIQKLLLSAKQQLAKAAREARAGGRVRIRRLNRLEYENTVRDLLQIDTALQDLLPDDDLADGFSNNTEALSISPVHGEMLRSLRPSLSLRHTTGRAACRWPPVRTHKQPLHMYMARAHACQLNHVIR